MVATGFGLNTSCDTYYDNLSMISFHGDRYPNERFLFLTFPSKYDSHRAQSYVHYTLAQQTRFGFRRGYL